jgi:hypothetical protein
MSYDSIQAVAMELLQAGAFISNIDSGNIQFQLEQIRKDNVPCPSHKDAISSLSL